MRSIIVLDGDMAKELTKRKLSNAITLPGNERPEDLFYKFLRSLEANDKFCGDTGGYTQQFCFKDVPKIGDRVVMKKWFTNQLPYWGLGAARLINRWKKENNEGMDKFIKSFKIVLDKFLKLY